MAFLLQIFADFKIFDDFQFVFRFFRFSTFSMFSKVSNCLSIFIFVSGISGFSTFSNVSRFSVFVDVQDFRWVCLNFSIDGTCETTFDEMGGQMILVYSQKKLIT